jgi:hypothetical protein
VFILKVIVILEQPSLFDLGEVYATAGANQALQTLNVDPAVLLIRHVTGDWAELSEEDQQENKNAVENGGRVFSSYTLPPDKTKIWIITEYDRSATTLLLPDEY